MLQFYNPFESGLFPETWKKRTIQYTLLILLSGCKLLHAQPSREAAWKEDIGFLRTTLPQKHVKLFVIRTEAEFNASLLDIEERINTLSDLAIVVKLQQAISLLGDSHTAMQFKKYLDAKSRIPLRLFWLKDGIYVIQAPESKRHILGCKITGVNGNNIQAVIDSLGTLVTKDNDAIIKKEIQVLLIQAQLLEYFGFTEGARVTFDFYDPLANKEFSEIIEADSSLINTISLKRDTVSFINKNNDKLFADQYDEKENIYYLLYNQCWSKELEIKYNNGKNADKLPSFEEFSRKAIKTIREKPVKKLIFDLRINPGGSSWQRTQLIRKLSKMHKVKKHLKIYVFISRHTFSSAILNAMDFKLNTSAVFVGEPTSGKPSHFGQVSNFRLPNSGLQISYSTRFFTRTYIYESTLEPDVKIILSIDDFRKGTDLLYEWVKKQ